MAFKRGERKAGSFKNDIRHEARKIGSDAGAILVDAEATGAITDDPTSKDRVFAFAIPRPLAMWMCMCRPKAAGFMLTLKEKIDLDVFVTVSADREILASCRQRRAPIRSLCRAVGRPFESVLQGSLLSLFNGAPVAAGHRVSPARDLPETSRFLRIVPASRTFPSTIIEGTRDVRRLYAIRLGSR